ncbi:DUF2267 domain-containing protein [Streptomyces formicae]|uniref:DUF2267 domain-containing protein n=1 Tax=Streptomyces formicae TaxID=1616117 RepID=A0A291QI06_9ACTN|nr:DUF2267 domain-containing protein [Streptomyces formicae]ATL31440.1 hypothetical protein KY5_6422c [Streptomyces formicae]
MNTSLEELLDQVRERGDFIDRQQAAGAVENVLVILGAHLVGDDRTDLARLLPQQCGALLADAEPASEPLTATEFVDAVASRTGDDTAGARRTVTAVLGTLAEAADDALLRRILIQLPPGHAGLFGCTEPG